jgi:hypothetical protein
MDFFLHKKQTHPPPQKLEGVFFININDKHLPQKNFDSPATEKFFFPVRIPRRPLDLAGPRHQIVSGSYSI